MTTESYRKQLLEEFRRYATLNEKDKAAFIEKSKAESAHKTDGEKALFQDAIFENLAAVKDRLTAIKTQIESRTQQSSQLE